MWETESVTIRGALVVTTPHPHCWMRPSTLSAKGCSLSPRDTHPGSSSLPHDHAPWRGREWWPICNECSKPEYWAPALLPPFGTLRPCQGQSCLWNLPRVWRQSTFPSAQSCLPPSPQQLHAEHYPRHRQHTHKSQNWFPEQHMLQQTITMHVFVRRCHLSIRPANTSWSSLTMTWRMRCLSWGPQGQNKKPLRKEIQPELGLTLCPSGAHFLTEQLDRKSNIYQPHV